MSVDKKYKDKVVDAASQIYFNFRNNSIRFGPCIEPERFFECNVGRFYFKEKTFKQDAWHAFLNLLITELRNKRGGKR